MKAAKFNILHQKNWDIFKLNFSTLWAFNTTVEGWYVQAYNNHGVYEGDLFGPFESRVAAIFWHINQK